MIFEFGISVHEKLRHFIIVMEKYTKNDGNQNFNGFNKVHEKPPLILLPAFTTSAVASKLDF